MILFCCFFCWLWTTQIIGTSSLHLSHRKESFNLSFEQVLKRKKKKIHQNNTKEMYINSVKKEQHVMSQGNKGHIAVLGFEHTWEPVQGGGHLYCRKLPQCLRTFSKYMDCATWCNTHQATRIWLLPLCSLLYSIIFYSSPKKRLINS